MSVVWTQRNGTKRLYAARRSRSDRACSQTARRQHGTCVSSNASGYRRMSDSSAFIGWPMPDSIHLCLSLSQQGLFPWA